MGLRPGACGVVAEVTGEREGREGREGGRGLHETHEHTMQWLLMAV